MTYRDLLPTSILSAFVAATLATAAHAAPPDAGQVLREQQPATPRAPARLPDQPQTNAPKSTAVAGPKVLVHTVHFSGADGLASPAQLEAQVRNSIGRELGFAELNQMAEQVTRYLRARGWFLARAYLPQQDVTAGRIEIAVLRGRLEGGASGTGLVIDSSGARVDEARVRNTLVNTVASTGTDDGLRGRDLERGLLLLDDLPGVSARAALEPGTVPDTARLRLDVTEDTFVPGTVSMDTYGNRYTGSARLGGEIAVNAPLRIGDQVTLAASGAERLGLGRVGYSLPLGYSGLRADLSYTALRYRVGEELRDLDARGSAQTLAAGLSYPLVRSRTLNVWAGLRYDGKALKNEALGIDTNDKRIDDLTLAVHGDVFDFAWGGGLTNFFLGATRGDLDLARVAMDADADALTARTQGNFTRYNFSLSRLQKLADHVSSFVGFNGQRASKNLDSAEEFMLGGPGAIRVYPAGEGSGDAGWLATFELRYDVPQIRFGSLQLVSFFDTGHVTLDKNPWAPAANAGSVNAYRLSATGLGLNFSSRRYVFRAAWATQVGDNPGRSLQGENIDGRHEGSRLWMQAQYSF